MPGRNLETEADVRRQLSRLLGHEPDRAIWDYLVEHRYVGDVLDLWDSPMVEMKRLLHHYRELEALGKTADKPKPRTLEIPPDKRIRARAAIIGLEAAELSEVRAFREKWLPDGLLADIEQAAAWIEARAKDEGSVRWVELPLLPGMHLPPSSDPGFWPALQDALVAACGTYAKDGRGPVGFRMNTLKYVKPGAEVATPIAIAVDGALAHLKSVCRTLVGRYGWREHAAALFVLAGIDPLPVKARLSVKQSFGGSVVAPPATITIEANARVSPSEIAKFYQEMRREVFPSKDRPLESKAAELAVFLYRSGREMPDITWEARKQAWNREHPDWEYSTYEQFRQEAVTAFRRVTGRQWVPPRGRDT